LGIGNPVKDVLHGLNQEDPRTMQRYDQARNKFAKSSGYDMARTLESGPISRSVNYGNRAAGKPWISPKRAWLCGGRYGSQRTPKYLEYGRALEIQGDRSFDAMHELSRAQSR